MRSKIKKILLDFVFPPEPDFAEEVWHVEGEKEGEYSQIGG